MLELNTYHIVTHGRNCWGLKKQGASRCSSLHSSEHEAIATGVQRLKKDERLAVHYSTGTAEKVFERTI